MGRSYKSVTRNSDVSAVSDACSALEELGAECREIVDNASENLQQTSRIQTFDETASSLESISEPSVPDCIQELAITYSEQVSARKNRGESRAVRCSNAVSVLQAASEAAQEWLEDKENAEHEDRDEVESFVSEIDNIVSDAENCEFPGMYG